jgi:methylated-DNA-[protein]-cysteine S-methyltransferase
MESLELDRVFFKNQLQRSHIHVQEYFRVIESPIGSLTIGVTGPYLTSLSFGAVKDKNENSATKTECDRLDSCAEQLAEYFAGERKHFELPIKQKGSEFQLSVWNALLGIPYGNTISYGEQARRIGRPKASRAVGAANGRNSIAIIVPCHRVVGASGGLTGFAGGIDKKQALINLETRFSGS